MEIRLLDPGSLRVLHHDEHDEGDNDEVYYYADEVADRKTDPVSHRKGQNGITLVSARYQRSRYRHDDVVDQCLHYLSDIRSHDETHC